MLRAAIGVLDIPQGVTVLRAAPADAAAFLAEELSAPEADLAVLIAANPTYADVKPISQRTFKTSNYKM